DMIQEQIFRKGFFGMAQGSIKSAPPVIFVIPGHRMMAHIGPSLITVLVNCQDNIYILVHIPEAVPLIGSLPGIGQEFGGRMMLIFYLQYGLLNRGVIQEISSHQPAVPSPVIFCCGGRMNTYITSSRLYVAPEISLLVFIEHISVGT